MIVQIIQHLVTVVPSLGFALLVAQTCAMSAADTKNLIAGTLIAMGISTALNAWGGRLGAGGFFVNIPNFDFMFIGPAAIAAAGLAGLAGEALIAALTCFLLRPLLPRMRELLPSTVVGTVVCMTGITLTVPAVKTSLGVDAAMRADPVVACISLVSLATIVGISVWGARRFKILAVIAGLVVGNLLTVFTGRMSLPEDFSSQPLFGAPQLIMPTLDLPLATLIGAVLISILGQIYNLGCTVVMDKQTDADWRRPDMRSAGGVFTANGIGDMIASFMGGIGTCIGSSNLALASASKTVSRHIGLTMGLILVALAFLPKAVAFVTLMLPLPVQGALQLYTAVFMFVGGIELATSRAPSNRTTFILGISICAGIAVLIMPGIAEHAPPDVKLVLSNGYLVTGIVAFVLNLIFRVGTGRTAECRFDDMQRPVADVISGFLESQGGQWQVRRDVLQRAFSRLTRGQSLFQPRAAAACTRSVDALTNSIWMSSCATAESP